MFLKGLLAVLVVGLLLCQVLLVSRCSLPDYNLSPPKHVTETSHLRASIPPPQSSQEITPNLIPNPTERQKEYDFTTAICLVVKDGELYFEEWIEYHILAMKFDAIYIYDDSPTFELQHWFQNTRNHTTFSKVHVIHYNRTLDEVNGVAEEKNVQKFVYRDCVNLFGIAGPKHDYFAFFDIDEFLVLPGYPDKNKYTDIRGVLQDYLVPYGGALTVNWMMIGSSNKKVASPLPLTKRFQLRSNQTHNVIKSIVKATDFVASRNPHAVTVKNNAEIHTTKFPGAKHKEAKGQTGASDHDYPSNILLLYHYRYTSQKEYIYKRCMRKDVDRGGIWCDKNGNSVRGKGTPEHIQSTPGDVFDDTAWRFLTDRVPKYKLYNHFDDFH